MRNKFVLFAISLWCICSSQKFHAQSTAFTYQGQLNDHGSTANGSYDLTFTLFGAPDGQGQIGNITTNFATVMTNGLFTATLDFAASFPGADRWLEVGVRTNGNGMFSTLSPRQKITPVPYAITALNVTASTTSLSGSYGGVINLSNYLNSFAGTFSGNGPGITNLSRVAETIVARNYGAIGNGIADDTAALQAAIDAANTQTNSSAGGYAARESELQLEAGTYRTTAPLWIRGKNGFKISGLGGEGQCSIVNNSSDIFIITNAANAWSQEPNSLTFQGLSLRSTGYVNVGMRFCATANTSDGIEIRDCLFTGFEKAIFAQGDGALGGVSNSHFENIDVYDNHYGIFATNGLFNGNRVEGIFVCNYGASFVIESGIWDISLRDSGGYCNAPTTNILWITGSPKVILRGGQSEFYGAPNGAAVLTTGAGGYELTLDTVTFNDYTLTGQPWAGHCWSIDLEDVATYTSFVHLLSSRMGVANVSYTGSPMVKITHSDNQRVTAIGAQRVVGGFFNNGFFSMNLLIQEDPIVITDVSANVIGQGASFWGYKFWMITNGVPKLFMSAPSGLVRMDASDAVSTANGNVFFPTNVAVGGVFSHGLTTASPANNSTLSPVSSYIRLIPSSAITLNNSVAIANGANVGAILVLEGSSDSNTVTVPNAAHTQLAAATRVLGLHDALSLLWNGTVWIETSFSNN